ncbi:MAG: electron transfer flavoprotein subunit beta [Betaproteobacteria bacterium]|nr:electron transfer flavoprotein subunit beta [Betaproteobacteria bacterium]
MNVLVLVSGTADPKWPLPPRLDAEALEAHARRCAVLSPFDEAALELALKLRDADLSVHITAVVAADEGLARQAANLRLDAVYRFDERRLGPWSARAFAMALAAALGQLDRSADLVLAGREFGDLDDGSVPPLLARAMGLPCVSLALSVAADADGLWVTRQRGPFMERQRLAGPTLLAVTNDTHNRLRHPLLKNVMAARKLRFAPLAAAIADGEQPISLGAVQAYTPAPREGACRMLTGAPAEQAEALAQVLAGFGGPQ